MSYKFRLIAFFIFALSFQSLFSQSLITPPSNGLEMWFQMNNLSATDSSVNKRNGLIYNGVSSIGRNSCPNDAIGFFNSMVYYFKYENPWYGDIFEAFESWICINDVHKA